MKKIFLATLIITNLVSQAQEADESTSKTIEGDQVFMDVDLPAEFMGGSFMEQRYLSQNLIVPDNVGDVNGNILFEFIVEKNGELSNIKIVKGLVPTVDSLAMKVVEEMPKWEPAFKGGVQVRQVMQYTITVRRFKKR